MIEAMWSAVFDANNQMIGTGIVVISNGKIMGGDSLFTYIGDCAIEKGIVTAQLRVRKYSNLNVPGFASITGLNDYELSLSGEIGYDNMTLVGHPQSLPHVKVTVSLSRLEELNWTSV